MPLLSLTSPPVDAVMLEARAASFGTRSIKNEAKLAAIDLAIRCIDLTTLEGRDSPGRVRSLCAKAAFPAPGAPRVAAVCVYPNLVAVAKDALRGTGVKVASVATAFPSGLSSLDVKLRDTEAALASGADEIDMVIDRGAFLAGDEARVYDEIVAVKNVCGDVHLKAILETGELGSYDATRRASDLALEAGADVIKTSTGKIGTSATLATALVMAEAIRDFARRTGERRGLKVAGGVRTTKAAIAYLVLLDESLGDPWLDPDLFRIGASALLDDLLLQREKLATGRYGSLDYVPRD
ncbi:2-deoxyribose-5-phosphate aldolase [Vulcanimicrobium alpinum]|uniref:Deoxyribose-phosphate aldolase n=1 Tax=Vulcanimicrobium alpinum TaxID=3016050 RepID=A0AAN1XWT0_UNVUL|nr:deoxyribose-phosphate aldolase [Vulcanimicrobium alpinum]BDE06415.1 2-deoxyribose-5-phosphate aldolase [Vulcanimicrobium alpinum]